MLASFEVQIVNVLEKLTNPYTELMERDFCKELRRPGALQERKKNALMVISRELRRVYKKPVVVLIDEYDSPMHSAMEHGYAASVRPILLLYCS
jgi:hypothetical protein